MDSIGALVAAHSTAMDKVKKGIRGRKSPGQPPQIGVGIFPLRISYSTLLVTRKPGQDIGAQLSHGV